MPSNDDPASDQSTSPYGDLSPSDRDYLIRTVIGEAGNDPGSAPGVAHVVLNRLASGQYGNSIPSVVLAPNQFESWDRQNLMSYAPTSPQYQQAAKVVDGVLSGAPDPTNGATKFYAPAAQTALGRQPPSWDDGSGVMLGKQKFFGGSPVSSDFLTDFAVAPPASQGKQSGQTSATPSAPSVSSNDIQSLDMSPAQFEAAQKAPSADFLTDFTVAPSGTAAASSTGNVLPPPPPGYSASGQPVSQDLAAEASFLNGVPIAGPYLKNGILDAAAWLRSKVTGEDQNQLSAAMNQRVNASEAAYPTTSTASGIGGGIIGTIPAMAAAPAAFGISGAGPFMNGLASGVTGAAIGGLDSGARSGWNLADMERGAKIGGAFGAVAPIAGNVIGSGVNTLSNMLSRTTPAARSLSGIMSNIGISPEYAQNALAQMGPHATLADIDPALTTEAGVLASLGGQPTSILKGAMATRAAGANNRVADAVDTHLGARPDLTAAQEGIQQQASKEAAPFYQAARASSNPVDVSPVLSYIDSKLGSAVGGVSKILNTAKSYLTDEVATLPGPDGAPVKAIVPKEDPQALLSARQALDDYIETAKRGGNETAAGKNALREASIVRSQLDTVLKEDPNIAAGDAAYATQMRNLNALNEGTELLKPSTRIEDVNRSIASKSPAEIAAMRTGALSSIHDAMDNARQGDFSAARSLFAKATANRAKLDALFPNSSKLFDTIDNEMKMRGTENHVAGNSKTAEIRAGQARYAPPQGSDSGVTAAILGNAVDGGTGALAFTGARAAFNGLKNSIMEGTRNRLIAGSAKGLAAAGPERDAFMGQLARAARTNDLTNALASGSSGLANLLTRNSGNALLPQRSQ